MTQIYEHSSLSVIVNDRIVNSSENNTTRPQLSIWKAWYDANHPDWNKKQKSSGINTPSARLRPKTTILITLQEVATRSIKHR